MPRAEPWRYEKLTWPRINDAIAAGREPVRVIMALPATARTVALRRDGVRRGRVVEHRSCAGEDTDG